MAVTDYKKKVKYATTSVVQEQIGKWDSTVVRCRSWRHAWDSLSAFVLPDGTGVEVQVCGRCDAKRHRILAKTGSIVAQWKIGLPLGYAMPRGSGRIAGHTYDQVRAAAFQSLKPKKIKGKDLDSELRKIIKGEVAT